MNNKFRTLCITLSILVLFGVAACFVFWNIIGNSVARIHANDNLRKEEIARLEQEKTLQVLIQNLGPDIKKIQSRIVESNGTPSFISKIESLARGIGATVTVSNVSVKPAEQEGEAFEYLSFDVASDGSWNQVYQLLTMIESLPYKVVLSNMTLGQGDFSEGEGQTNSRWKATFAISVLKKK